MKFLIVNTDYPEFLSWLYARQPGLESRSYEEQMRARMESLFGVADFYSSNLGKLGHEAWDIYPNNEFMQKAWAREHGICVDQNAQVGRHTRHVLQDAVRTLARSPLRYLKPMLRPLVRSINGRADWFYEVLASQITHHKPDVIVNQAMESITSDFLREMRPNVKLVVGQHAAPLGGCEDFSSYDLVISSLPNFVERFRHLGLPAELHRFAFEPRVLTQLGDERVKSSVSFVGSLSQHHKSRVELLEYLCTHLDMEVWGVGVESLPKDSPIRQRHKGAAWGIEMYDILHNSKITVNHHIGVAESYANNMRLFEAAGVGTLLVTDWKENLNEILEPGQEVVAYQSPEDCARLIQYYLEHDRERQAIASAGQRRVLREHNYYHRMEELVEITRRYL